MPDGFTSASDRAAFIAGLPIVLVATLVVLNLRGEARDGFLDSSSREIRQVSNAMNIFFQGITQNVEYLAAQPLIAAANGRPQALAWNIGTTGSTTSVPDMPSTSFCRPTRAWMTLERCE